MRNFRFDNISNQLIEDIFSTIETPITLLDGEGTILHFNPACESLTGYNASEAVGRKIWDLLILKEEIDAVRGIFEKTRTQDIPTHFTNHWKVKDGSRRLLRWTKKAVRNEAGEIEAVIATAIDLTDLKTIERAFSESQSFLRSIMDSSPEAVVTINEQGEILSFSRHAEIMFGYKAVECIGQRVNILMAEPDFSRQKGYISRYVKTDDKRIIDKSRTIVARRKNGDEFPASLHVTEFLDGHRIFVGFIEDITEHQATEQRLAETQSLLQHAGRVSAMGEMATTIAHELNQPLTAAASLTGAVALTLKKEEFSSSDEVLSMLNDVVSEIRRASEIIHQMREFVRKRKTARSLHNVNRIIKEAGALALIGADAAGVTVDWSLGDEVGDAQLDGVQIQQVLTNLVRNAIDAMKNTPEKHLSISTARSDDVIEVRVADTGAGLSRDIKRRIFEPFVSDKTDGVGVGLSICKSIIDSHQGEISATNVESGGCVFTFKLPAGGYEEAEH